MRKMRSPEQSRIQCVASSGDLTPSGVARLLRSLATCSTEAVAVRVLTNERPTLMAALEVIPSDAKTEVHVRAETTSPTLPEIWESLRSDPMQLHGIAVAGSGLDASITAESTSEETVYEIGADFSMPDLSPGEWERRWQACLRALPAGVEPRTHDDGQGATVEGVVSSLAAVEGAMLAIATVCRPQRSMFHWLVAREAVEELAARRLEKVIEAHSVEDGLSIEYQVMGFAREIDLAALARLLAAQGDDMGMEVVVTDTIIGASGGNTLAPGSLVITGSDVVWVPTGRVLSGAMTAVLTHLEKVVGRRLVVVDQPANEFKRCQTAAEVAGYATALLSGEASVCDDCGGVRE